MMLYAAIVLGVLFLTEAADYTHAKAGDSGKRRLLAITGLVLFTCFFSLILSIFRSKAGGYPYSFLIK
jgi:oligosaccharyltransferase complex subunit gamma